MGISAANQNQISHVLKKEKNIDAFITQLRELVGLAQRDDWEFRLPEVHVPRSHDKSRLVAKAITQTNRLRNTLDSLLLAHSYRSAPDRHCIVSELVDLQRFEVYLQRVHREVTPRGNSTDRHRNRHSRYLLRSLMWLWVAYFPRRPISKYEKSKFYRVAEVCLESIRVYRKDIRSLIQQEKEKFEEDINRSPMPDFSKQIEEGRPVVIQVMHDS